MKVLVLTDDVPLRQALFRQFESRSRHCLLLDPALLSSPGAMTAQLRQHAGSLLLLAPAAAGPDTTWADQLGRLAECCRETGSHVLLISSSLVFSGEKTSYRETDETLASDNPWLAAEQAVLAHFPEALIVRTTQLFSAIPDNQLTRILQQLQAGGDIPCDNQWRAAPTAAADLARVCSAMIDQISCGAELSGVYHYSSAEPVTCFQFVEAVYAAASQYLGSDSLAIAVSATGDSVAPGWAVPRLNCDKIRDTFGIKQLPWRSFIGAEVSLFFND